MDDKKIMVEVAEFEHLLEELQCPVCLLIPREGPVGACPVGHIVCKNCTAKGNVETCPTCRRPMPRDGTNTVVNKMIEEISHPCKYKQFGCEIKQRLNELVVHESKCPERTIKCPRLRCCEEVQIKKFYDHATRKCCFNGISIDGECWTDFHIRNGENIEHSIFSRDSHWLMNGFEKSGRGNLVKDLRLRRLRVDLTEKVEMCVDCQRYFVSNDSLKKHLQEVHKLPCPKNDVSLSSSPASPKEMKRDIFYLHQYFFTTERTFAFYVTGEAEPEKYLVKITLKNFNDERRFITNVLGVVSMDSAPRDKYEVLASKNVMFIPWRQMRGFLKWTEKDGKQTSRIHAKVEVIDA